ncbi:hypothetical protein ACIBH1_44705 [Nonomuraea sp. NPDC050663]|uniref:hypothetical protein n=1 Tax=Nonomuraea sp. NPDC050663 TaxID=3364370 RepID=UPI0037877AC2
MLQGYTRNRCYRVTEIEYYTGCDYRAEHLQPLPDHGYAYLARHSHDGPFIIYTPGSPCTLCAPTTDAAPGCAAPRQHARDQVAE